jgi:molecular chaperone GrpE (heat shock protein)
MTPEQIQEAIEGMLSVQRELQNTQLRFSEEIGDLKEAQKQTLVAMDALLELSKATERKIERLVGYSITQESDVLDVRADILNLKRRVTALEGEEAR